MLLLSHAAVSTSGSARQMAKIGGAEYSHVLDPRTGLGMTEGRQVSVQAPSAALADALATAGNVMREEDFRSLGGTVAGSVRPGFFPEFLTFCGRNAGTGWRTEAEIDSMMKETGERTRFLRYTSIDHL